MIIESSKVEMSSETMSSYEMVSHSQVDFRTELLGLFDVNEKTQSLESDGYKEVDGTKEVEQTEAFVNPYEDITRMILELVLQAFLGGNKKVDLKSLNDLKCKDTDSTEEAKKMLMKRTVSIETTHEYYRSDSISFSSQATIKTKDKDINIDLDLSYSREFYEKHSETLKFEETHFLDPLVIQYDCASSAFDSISDKMCFNFDINSDKDEKELPLLKDGNGFLVLDKDENGTIDNGSELFGPSSNDGFGELSEYDSDGNNWIDENDPIFDKLQIWTKNESGEDKLIALGQTGIGAIYLNDAKAGMAYNKSVNESLAYLKSNSIFLREDGTAGIISSMDFRS
ncbi:conserved hypothetical protein [Arcobacter nitrofigilis DSM 7299]|uniref:Uncharacterized protein n=1 Tax=Arcobacter nitrofigilis (strain ATCC 33309 / DSM 7299 / CCUG 15893 / LMG 7604 / NCTC 12251 / CI) TaxID=572480 RepID=D5V227_ARCNC|nr:hypothetical protein [Arcobacter nitrofigilis]ADG92260.1 conserved hypothetical protein [Arcobacter nitrofigilis DSM 7299]